MVSTIMVLRKFTISLLDVDIISKLLHFKYPLTLSLFNVPRISDTTQEDLFQVVRWSRHITPAFGLTLEFRPFSLRSIS